MFNSVAADDQTAALHDVENRRSAFMFMIPADLQ